MKKTSIFLSIIALVLLAMHPSVFFFYAQTPQPTVSLDPPSYIATELNETFDIHVTVSNIEGLWGWAAKIHWDPQYLALDDKKIREGNFMTDQVDSTAFLHVQSPTSQSNESVCDISGASFSLDTANGTGVLATLQFKVIQQCGQTPIFLSNITLSGPSDPHATTIGQRPQIIPASDSFTATVSLLEKGPPVANAGSNKTVPLGAQFVLNASQSTYTGSNPAYTWSFVDGTPKTLSGVTANYTFNNAGTYNITLTVQDSLGSDTSTVIITVLPATHLPPTITVSGKSGQPLTAGDAITFGITNDHIGNTTVQKYEWLMGDGAAPIITTNSNVTHVYSTPGSYAVTLTTYYTDGENDTSSSIVEIMENMITSSPTPNLSSSASPSLSPTVSGGLPSPTSSTFSPSPTFTHPPAEESPFLPPTIIGVLVAVTIFILCGSAFWLRKRT